MLLIFLVNKTTYEIREKNLNRELIESHKEIKELSAKLNVANMDIGSLKAEIKRYKNAENDMNEKLNVSNKVNEEVHSMLRNKVEQLKTFIMRK